MTILLNSLLTLLTSYCVTMTLAIPSVLVYTTTAGTSASCLVLPSVLFAYLRPVRGSTCCAQLASSILGM